MCIALFLKPFLWIHKDVPYQLTFVILGCTSVWWLHPFLRLSKACYAFQRNKVIGYND